jgi:ubiquinone/menaquinone biosynthesis C-methylase UbiE
MQDNRGLQLIFAAATFLLAVGLVIDAMVYHDSISSTQISIFFVLAVICLFFSYAIVAGLDVTKFNLKLGKDKGLDLDLGRAEKAAEAIAPRVLDVATVAKKEAIAKELQKEHPLPGEGAPQFSAISPEGMDDLLVRPSAYPTTPMYLLDNAFRIIDWNDAFTIAFDRTMEGRKGKSVLEWTYFLDNYEMVLAHGVEKFSSANKVPLIDVEKIEYTSQRYGKIEAVKRAYQIPDDREACLGWLVTLDLKFVDPLKQAHFDQDLIRQLGWDLMWSEYALSYDRILNNTKVYPELLDRLIGGYENVRRIPEEAVILDLGAGTGNLSKKLIAAGRDRVIFAAENNRMMLKLLRSKCERFLRKDPDGGGVIAFKQDITSLYGLDDAYFDFVLLNNVLYAVQDADACLAEAYRVLKPGGELRLSGPRKDSNLDVLFACIEKELKEAGKFEELEADFRHVQSINKQRLSSMLYRWTTDEVEELLGKAGFKVFYVSKDAYAGQSMLICAAK